MTQENPPSGEKPKKNTLKLLLRSKPAAQVETLAGRVYLYPLRVRDMTDFGKLKPGDAVSQIRAFLPSIGSLTVESDEAPERVPLDAAITADLSNDEIERIADAYAQSSAWQTIREGSQERTPAVREADETASVYLVRLLKAEVEDYHQRSKRMHEKMFGSAQSLFDQVRKSTSALGSTLSAYEELTKIAKPAPLEIQPIRTDHFDALNMQMAQQVRERAEERAEEMEMTRLTGKMTAESAKTLKDLAEAATTLMEQMDERDRKTDQSTRTQIKIALWSVASSAVLSLVAAVFAGFSFFQDRDNNTSGDQWQVKLLTVIEQGNQQRSTVERENQALREQMKALDARIVDLEAAQRAEASKAASAARRETNPGNTRPPP
ncbi:hypothetical protein BN948_01443 [Hydrogenophaga intermedia]|uniref:Uncharacterized protein n=1 Tax=Hydrogenophaga intermedia TaxID=65786 RepID=A0A1L1PDZ6_HYDIT|nr:hypothetical protein Q5W_04525 [Hydrogenophaga sp. PBC]CDN87024.1 hypothetical protein BN948_01443 [Hydrogenophaga intermedia]